MTAPRDIWAVVPMKATSGSKQRLAGALSPALRQELATAMFTDVMTTLSAVTTLAGIAVVTIDPKITTIAQSFGARIITDGATDGHTGAVTAAGRMLAGEGRHGMLALPGDIPLVTPQEIEHVLATHPAAPAFSIVAAHDGRGSNAVLLTPPDVLALRFGDDSFVPHVAEAERLGIALRRHELPGIGLDIDTPADLAEFIRAARVTRASALLAAHAMTPGAGGHV
jgi:2-phospho-L-lactate guanylyltransferase